MQPDLSIKRSKVNQGSSSEQTLLTLSVPETKIAEFANSVDLDEVAHNEPPHPDLHCLLSNLQILNMIQLGHNIFENCVVCILVVKELKHLLSKLFQHLGSILGTAILNMKIGICLH